MKPLHCLVASAAMIAAATFATAAQNQGVALIDGPTYVMTYVEVIPSATNQTVAALKEYRDASRREQGANFVDIYQEDGQSYRFVVSEVWQNRAAASTHSGSATTSGLFQKLKGVELGPPDVRIHQAHSATPPKAPGANGVIVISHCDVAGGNTQNLMNAFAPLSEATRKENGMVRYEILDEVPAHANHFRLLEEWASVAAFEAHNRAPHTQTYRQAIMPWLGTPYDQRMYKVVN
jgi:quinol monooxygenase YgiN